VAEKSDGLNHLLDLANKRSRYAARTEFPPAIVKFGKRVEEILLSRGVEITLKRYRQEFINYGVGKVGFHPYVEKIVPEIHTEDEFVNLLSVLGYDVVDEEELEVDLRVLVCGSRDWEDGTFMLKHLRQLPKGTTIIEGAAPGADTLAALYAKQLGFEIDEYPANWGKYHRAAGPIRNKQMLEEGQPDVVLAFHEDIAESKGTRDMCIQAKKAGIPVKILSGAKQVDIASWLEEVIEYE